MNPRFSDYVTSGAFALTLTRNQVTSLSLIVGDGSNYIHNAASLERKGLIEVIAKPELFSKDGIEYRATFAGLLCAGMLAEAGLSNGPQDAVRLEFDAMRAELAAARADAFQSRQAGRAALARQQEAEAELENARREIVGLKTRTLQKLVLPNVRLRDPIPEVSDADLAQLLQEPVGG